MSTKLNKGDMMKKIFLYVFAGLFLFSSSAYAVTGYGNRGRILNKTLVLNAEQAVTLPNGIDGLTIQSRTAADFKLGFVTTESGTNYFTVKSGTVFNSPVLGLSTPGGDATTNTTFFIQSGTNAQVIEFLYWE